MKRTRSKREIVKFGDAQLTIGRGMVVKPRLKELNVEETGELHVHLEDKREHMKFKLLRISLSLQKLIRVYIIHNELGAL
jgi:hypothetical protein